MNYHSAGYPAGGILGHEEFIFRDSGIVKMLQNELKGNVVSYDRALKHMNLNCVLTLPSKKEVKDFVKDFPMYKNSVQVSFKDFVQDFPIYKNYVQVWSEQRATIERIFGIVVNQWQILKYPFQGRGDYSLERQNEMIMLAMQLTNISFRFEKMFKARKHIANMKEFTFDDLLMRLDESKS